MNNRHKSSYVSSHLDSKTPFVEHKLGRIHKHRKGNVRKADIFRKAKCVISNQAQYRGFQKIQEGNSYFHHATADAFREGQERFRTLDKVTNNSLTLNARLGRKQEDRCWTNGNSNKSIDLMSVKSAQSFASSKEAPQSEVKVKKAIVKSLQYLHHFIVPKDDKRPDERLKRKIRQRFEKCHNGNKLTEDKLDILLPISNADVNSENAKMEDHKTTAFGNDQPDLKFEYFDTNSFENKFPRHQVFKSSSNVCEKPFLWNPKPVAKPNENLIFQRDQSGIKSQSIPLFDAEDLKVNDELIKRMWNA